MVIIMFEFYKEPNLKNSEPIKEEPRYINFCKHIIDFRVRTGQSVDEIAKNTNISAWEISFLCWTGSQDSVTLETFLKLCDYLQVSPNEMISPIEITKRKTPADK